ncbi:Aerobic C4-dicarboxylate transporter for fumarate, L-malate, D-malate, succunate, aspartate [Caballeronia glathei]|jgi:aerobic C4-dicarboxylate transport protein|uniref:C4-dicarboxylate transport protein n=1 Tax=Caballeronia glathei TaxID=60547 RepID=A0A069PFI7_9BURK|nr:dicarboxylate/amino acid:cation symporter [Caballeronia glathei]KDR39453.1 C4-dicarboxylate transporter [Caballeronia glathei]CDY79372.1 Aerobic C4-dicarboxylate transporter for fumarate, L-malate, D-malate, succunate, aspartate [Caballeronia glathei]
MRRFFGKLYVQVLIGVFAGVALGVFAPNIASDFKPMGDIFIKLIKMVFAPIIFATVVLGIARMENMKELGRVGVRALIYFEVLSTFALALGLLVVNVVGPGNGMNIDAKQLDTQAIATYTAAAAKPEGFVQFVLHLVPTSIVDALAKNDILQILVFSTLFGIALSHIGAARAKPVVDFLDSFTHGVFSVVGMIMRLAPLAAFGAMAFTVGKYGLGSIVSLGKLMGTMYITCFLFVTIVLGMIARISGFSLWKFLKYIKDELFTVLGTSSSESVVPQLMRKLEHLGVAKPVVGLVVPSGLTFNPDGQCIYYTMAAIFVAQATNTPLSMTDQLVILGVLLLTSKGSAGVTGSGFITLAATLASMGKIPVAGMVLLLGVDRFMSEARAITNTIGNAVGTVAIARWVGSVDRQRMAEVLNGKGDDPEDLETLYEGDDAPSAVRPVVGEAQRSAA